MTYLGELVLIKEEDVQIKEEELEIKHEATFFDEMEEVSRQGEKRSWSLSSEVLPESKKRFPGAEENKFGDEQSMTNLDLCRPGGTGSAQNISISESPTIMQNMNNVRSLQHLTSQTRKVVMSIHDYFRSQNQVLSETDLQIKVATATGISVRSVQRVKRQAKEGWIESPPARVRQAPVMDNVDDFREGCIRREILSFYERGEIPTISNLLEIVKEPPIDFQGGRSSLNNLIKRIGYQYMKVEGGRRIMLERDDIVAARCKVLRMLNDNRDSSNPHSEIYVDEMWVSQRESMGTIRPKLKTGKEAQLIIVHAGGEKGFVPGGLLMFKPPTGAKGDYHNAMNPECFRTWFMDQLLPNIPSNSLIIMDSAPCHSKLGNRVPNRSMKKCDIIQWLVENNIVHDTSISKSELLHLVNSNKEKRVYEIDLIAHDHGHEVLRLPRYHNHLNPIELIWSQVRSEIKRKYSDVNQTLQKLEELTKDAIARVTAEDWRMCMDRTREMEEDYRNKDKSVDHLLENLAINLDELSSDEED